MMVIVTRSWQAWRNLHLHLRLFDSSTRGWKLYPSCRSLFETCDFIFLPRRLNLNSKFQLTPIQSVSSVDTSDEFLSLCSCGAVCERTDGVISVPVQFQFMSSRHSSLLMAILHGF